MTTTMTPSGLCQRNETLLVLGCDANARTPPMPASRPTNAPVPVGAPEAEREHEHAEQRAVEERPEPVDHLDQRSEPDGEGGDAAGERVPRQTSPSFETRR